MFRWQAPVMRKRKDMIRRLRTVGLLNTVILYICIYMHNIIHTSLQYFIPITNRGICLRYHVFTCIHMNYINNLKIILIKNEYLKFKTKGDIYVFICY